MLAERQAAVRVRIGNLVAERAAAGPAGAELIDQHLHRLRGQLAQLEQDWRTRDTAITLWNLGSRPRHLQDAIIRRANHLAHTAIADGAPWVASATAAWTQHHRLDDADNLHRLLVKIAAHREHHTIAGDDPIGPAPTAPGQHAAWQQLHDQLLDPTSGPHAGGLGVEYLSN